jgi:nucleoside-diphosphate-sugar epimerase
MDNKVYGYDFELGRGKNVSVNEVAEMMNIIPIYKDPKPGEARHTLNQDQQAGIILGWNPKINLIDYLKK